MYRKLDDLSSTNSCNSGVCCNHDPLGRYIVVRYTAVFLLLIKTSGMFTCFFMAGVLLLGCTPPSPVVHTCPEPLWTEYTTFLPYKIREEEIKLEALLAAGDTIIPHADTTTDSSGNSTSGKFSVLDINRRLFELSIHQANPDFNVDKISGYALLLARYGGPDSLRYLNWNRAAREYKTLIMERDSLETAISAISAISDGEKKEARSIEVLKKEIKIYQKQRDSLTMIISSQQEMISKLQKLDVLMEQQRNKIQ